MIRLTDALNAWGTPGFEERLRMGIEALGTADLPLQQGLARTSHALAGTVRAMPIAAVETRGSIRAKVGVFFSGVIAGCSCADDPTPVDEQTEYCVLQVEIDRATAEATITLLPE